MLYTRLHGYITAVKEHLKEIEALQNKFGDNIVHQNQFADMLWVVDSESKEMIFIKMVKPQSPMFSLFSIINKSYKQELTELKRNKYLTKKGIARLIERKNKHAESSFAFELKARTEHLEELEKNIIDLKNFLKATEQKEKQLFS